MPIDVQQRGDVAVWDELVEEWNALLQRSVVNTLFLTPTWQKIWWRHFGDGLELRVLLARDETGALQGIAPLYAVEKEGRRLLQLVGGVDVSDYLDFIVGQGHEEEVYRAFLSYLVSGVPGWELLDLHCLPGDSPTRAGLICRVCSECCSCQPPARQEESTPYIPLPGDWESYLETLDKKQRHEIRRKLRKAETEAQVRWRRLQDAAELDQEVDIFIRLHQASHPEKEAFMTPAMAAFFRDLAHATLATGQLSLYTLWLDERPVASMWCFDYGRDLLVYNSGYDPTWRPELSSGIVLLCYCIQDAIARGMERFDFMRGSEVYKYRFGAVEAAVYHLVVVHPALRQEEASCEGVIGRLGESTLR